MDEVQHTDSDVSLMLVRVASAVFLVCASVLFFIAFLRLPVALSSAGALVAIFFGMIISFRSAAGAQAVLVISFLVMQAVIVIHEHALLGPFAVLDAMLLYFITRRVRQSG